MRNFWISVLVFLLTSAGSISYAKGGGSGPSDKESARNSSDAKIKYIECEVTEKTDKSELRGAIRITVDDEAEKAEVESEIFQGMMKLTEQGSGEVMLYEKEVTPSVVRLNISRGGNGLPISYFDLIEINRGTLDVTERREMSIGNDRIKFDPAVGKCTVKEMPAKRVL